MTGPQSLQLLRATRLLLAKRGMCGAWLPAQAAVCARRARHPSPCGYYKQEAA